MDTNEETLQLTSEYSLGEIAVYVKGHGDLLDILEAKGLIRVPAGATLNLSLSQEICDDLRRLRDVPARLLSNRVAIIEKRLDKTDFGALISHPEITRVLIGVSDIISAEQQRQLGRLPWLEQLYFAGTELDGFDFSWLLNFPRLKSIDFWEVLAPEGCLLPLIQLPLLEHVGLRSVKLCAADVRIFWSLKKLEMLGLNDCCVGNDALQGIGECRSLRLLSLGDARVTDAGVEIISRDCSQLRSLHLDSCLITDRSLSYISTMKAINTISVWGTSVTREGVAHFKRALPKCRVSVEKSKL
jgi:hypothetical protein